MCQLVTHSLHSIYVVKIFPELDQVLSVVRASKIGNIFLLFIYLDVFYSFHLPLRAVDINCRLLHPLHPRHGYGHAF